MACYAHTPKSHSHLGHGTNVTPWGLLSKWEFNLELLGTSQTGLWYIHFRKAVTQTGSEH